MAGIRRKITVSSLSSTHHQKLSPKTCLTRYPDRKGTMVHPDYQKKGFGTELTKYCNAISDKSGDRTWVPARPTSVEMFRNNGFKDIGSVDAHLERWGGPRDKSITWTLVRNAPSYWGLLAVTRIGRIERDDRLRKMLKGFGPDLSSHSQKKLSLV